jgi:hypothetical protein
MCCLVRGGLSLVCFSFAADVAAQKVQKGMCIDQTAAWGVEARCCYLSLGYGSQEAASGDMLRLALT